MTEFDFDDVDDGLPKEVLGAWLNDIQKHFIDGAALLETVPIGGSQEVAFGVDLIAQALKLGVDVLSTLQDVPSAVLGQARSYT